MRFMGCLTAHQQRIKLDFPHTDFTCPTVSDCCSSETLIAKCAAKQQLVENSTNTPFYHYQTYIYIDRKQVLPHTQVTGDWLHSPLPQVAYHLSDAAVRIAVGYQMGTITIKPHICQCGSFVNARRLHALFCRKSTSRHIRHEH